MVTTMSTTERTLRPWNLVLDDIWTLDDHVPDLNLGVKLEIELAPYRSSVSGGDDWTPAPPPNLGYRHPLYYERGYAFAERCGIPIYTDQEYIDPMSDEAHAKIIRQLTDQINEYDHYYFNLNTSLISDAEYDQLLQKLIMMEEQFPHLKCVDTPTARVAPKPGSDLTKVPYENPMLSLGKVFRPEDVVDFMRRVVKQYEGAGVYFSCEPKLDGLAVRLVYKRGILKEATTRGDGSVGEDILKTVSRVHGVPYKLSVKYPPERLEVRGEVVADLFKFNDLNKQLEVLGQKPYANVRNFVSGNLRQKDPSKVHGDVMQFLVYEVVPSHGMPEQHHGNALLYVGELGLTPVDNTLVLQRPDYSEEVNKFIEYWSECRERLGYEIDGLVFKVDGYDRRAGLGATNHHPRWAVAYKFPPAAAITVLEEIVITVGRTGVITPVGRVQPVKVGGVVVERANLHNFDSIAALKLDVGDRIELVRAGDVIPDVKRVVDKLSARQCFPAPVVCPCCKSMLTRKPKEVEYYCTNKECIQRQRGQLIYFAGRDCANIQQLGDVVITDLLIKGFVEKPSDFYKLTQAQLETVVSPKIAAKIHANIQKAKGFSLDKFIQLLGIRGVGERTAQALATYFSTIDDFLNTPSEEYWKVDGVDDVIARCIYEFLGDEDNRSEISELLKHGVTTGVAETPGNGPLSGQVWCITGSFVKMNRNDIKKYLKEKGAEVTKDVNKRTTHLLMGDNPGNKLDKALKQKCIIVDDANFTSL